jgi:hypothetical protein
MSNGIVLNHCSLPFESRECANKGILVFFKVLKVCRRSGLKILLVDADQDKSLMRLQLAEGYFISDWLNQAKNNSELTDWSRFLRSLETKQPLFEQADIDDIDGGVDVGLKDSSGCPVLLAAYWLETFVVSFATIEKWLTPFLSVWVVDLREGSDEVKEDQLCNLANDACLTQHEQILAERRNELIRSANDIWHNRAELFPNLTLLSNQIGTALKTWSHRQDVLLKARDALNILESFSLKWKNNEYADYQHCILRDLGLAAEVSGESPSVTNDPKKKKERMFWLDDGRQIYCENHVKLPDGYRLHFYPDSIKKHIYVAYLGPHLTL